MIFKMLEKFNAGKRHLKKEYIHTCAYLVCLHLWMTGTVPGWPKSQEVERRCCCPCPRPSSSTPAPGPAWQSPACLPPPPNAPLPSVACWQHEVSWQTNQFCSEQSLSSYGYLVYHAHWPMAVSRCMVKCLSLYAFPLIPYSQGSIAWSLENVW